jgi:hypothetical protein
MKAVFLAVTAMALIGVTANAEQSKKVYCVVSKGTLAGSDMNNSQPYTLDISKIKKEGEGPSEELGSLGKINIVLSVYLTDKASKELKMQFNEADDSGATGSEKQNYSILTSTVLAKSGMTQLMYRAPGDVNLLFAACGLMTDRQIKSLEQKK